MTHARQTEKVRHIISVRFGQLGCKPNTPPRESLLICQGHYCGRRFEADGLRATWFITENELKIYGRDGGVAQVIDVEQAEESPLRRAG